MLTEWRPGPLSGAKLTAILRSPTSNVPPANEQLTQTGSADGRKLAEAAIDPLSQQILKRTNTSSAVQKLRAQADNASLPSPTSPSDSYADTKVGTEASRDLSGGANTKQEKKKGVSFLSRFIGNKKKGTLEETAKNGSDAGESRHEGMDAQLFSHTVDNLGFNPKHPQPPAYIKELRSGADKKAPPATGSNPAPQSGSAATHNPIWALEFSKDGKYVAAGGQDRIVRVWAVISTPEERRAHENEEADPDALEHPSTHLSAPVFQQRTFKEYHGHTATILDLSWSKNNFLLSSSMDKTVRLWHLTRSECLCTFKHTDFVPSIQFHPRDDRFFLAGSLDTKLRLWSIPDKSVAFWNQLPDMITAVAFTPDGKTCIAGTLSGLCLFYETEGLKYQTQIHVKSTRGQNAKGSKITGIQATYWPPGSNSGEVKLLITSNDSRVRMYNFRDKSLEAKFRGHENNCSQIRATFADDSGYVVSGSEDRKAYIWSTCAPEGEKSNQRPMELFDAHNSITTCAIFAPLKTRQLLSNSEDPVFDLCNPPPVTLISRAESINSSRPATEAGGSALQTPADSTFKRVAESPAYIARSAHPDGNIVVTADHTGAIKVFRQDCAYMKRLRSSEAWDTSSVFSKKRPSSILSRTTGRSRRDSTSTQPPNDRIMSWRQDISHGSFDSVNGPAARRSHGRSVSPRKSAPMGMGSPVVRAVDSPTLRPMSTRDTLRSSATEKLTLSRGDTPSESLAADNPSRKNSQISAFDPTKPQLKLPNDDNPLSVYNGQSWAFWNNATLKQHKIAARQGLAPEERPDLLNRISTISKLSDEVTEAELSDEAEVKCKNCGGEEFKVRVLKGTGGKEEKRLVCTKCLKPVG
ncbi:WD40-repeat-containing domain protein [Clohesyomyces aquaticus]|uniref:WD40-repeat-containing domain protein n=1 Tax=Clohesyomyces aquaticus TaxID=1231657 RepID=A0A1Y2AB57_9PLEO|nr:WD40-repeat-containing domain protein [Clohesyomyces aquaticus]